MYLQIYDSRWKRKVSMVGTANATSKCFAFLGVRLLFPRIARTHLDSASLHLGVRLLFPRIA